MSLLMTLADPKQLKDLIKGTYLYGLPFPRIAFVGRSNVGKSSLLNALMGAQQARVSKTPGRTRVINFFEWRHHKSGVSRILTDMPGYGFAKFKPSDREEWSVLIEKYLAADPGLTQLLVLFDARHGPTKLDVEALEFISSLSFDSHHISFVFTKSDEVKTQSDRARRLKETTQQLKELGFGECRTFWVSTYSKKGIDELMEFILSQDVEIPAAEATLEEDEIHDDGQN